MPFRVANSPKHFQDATRSGVRALPGGGVERASANLFRNPSWTETADGKPVGLTVIPFPVPLSWHVYTLSGRQNAYPVNVGQATYLHPGAIRGSYVAPQVGSTGSLNPPPARPAAPTASAVAEAALGFGAGEYAVALAWMNAAGEIGTLSARAAVTLSVGGIITLSGMPVPLEIPPGATGLVVALTESQTTPLLATTATLYVQTVIPYAAVTGASTSLTAPLQTYRVATAVSALAAPDAPTAVTSVPTLAISGTHKVMVTLDYGTNFETQASPKTNVTLTTGQTLQVTRPTLPTGSCGLVSLIDADRPTALAGMSLLFLRYVAPVGTPQGYRVAEGPSAVVTPGTQYTVSQHIKTESASACSLSEMLFRDEAGNAIGVPQPLATPTGTNAWTRYTLTLTAPALAVTLEVYRHQVGAGTVTLAPPQLDQAASATAFNPVPPASGYFIKTFDTAYGGDGSGPIASIQRPTGTVPVGVNVVSNDTYALSYASSPTSTPPGGTWATDPANIVFDRYIHVRVALGA